MVAVVFVVSSGQKGARGRSEVRRQGLVEVCQAAQSGSPPLGFLMGFFKRHWRGLSIDLNGQKIFKSLAGARVEPSGNGQRGKRERPVCSAATVLARGLPAAVGQK